MTVEAVDRGPYPSEATAVSADTRGWFNRNRSEIIRRMEALAQRCGSALTLKWKDTSPDSLTDLRNSDVCISNYSSILNGFYFTHKPSIHTASTMPISVPNNAPNTPTLARSAMRRIPWIKAFWPSDTMRSNTATDSSATGSA